jgi:hypothetical protein
MTVTRDSELFHRLEDSAQILWFHLCFTIILFYFSQCESFSQEISFRTELAIISPENVIVWIASDHAPPPSDSTLL